jgi:hypothetical protein
VAVGTLWWSTAVVLATWALPMLGVALVGSRMLPDASGEELEAAEPVSG